MIAGVLFIFVNYFEDIWLKVLCMSGGIFTIGIVAGIIIKSNELKYVNQRLTDELQ